MRISRRRPVVVVAVVATLMSFVAVGSAPTAALPIPGGYADPLPSSSAKSGSFLDNDCGRAGYGGYPVDNSYHTGTDWSAPVGSPVYAIAAGRTVYAGSWGSGWGSGVHILHTAADGSQFAAAYGHIDLSVVSGQTVAKGQKIGTIAGIAGPHLHFGIRPGWNVPSSGWGLQPCSTWPAANGYVDPLPYLTRHPLSGSGGGGSTNLLRNGTLNGRSNWSTTGAGTNFVTYNSSATAQDRPNYGATNAASAGGSVLQDVVTSAGAGSRWTATVWLRAQGSVASGDFCLWAAGVTAAESSCRTYSVPGDRWTQFQVVLNPGRSHDRLRFQIYPAVGGGTTRFDTATIG